MTVLQSNAAPISSKDALQIVTLKNLVALDLVEQNEVVLKSFGLFDDSTKKINIQKPLTNEQIQKQIHERQIGQDLSDELKRYKNELQTGKDAESKQLLDSLASDFLADEIAVDDTDDLIRKFEKENNVKVVIDDNTESVYYKVDAQFLKRQVENGAKAEDHQEGNHELPPAQDGDLEMS
jgi:hypothetical protein